MNLFRIFSRPASAPAARDRLKLLLAHERSSAGGSDMLTQLRVEILAVIARHMPVDEDKVSVRLERGKQVSTLAVDIEIPLDMGKCAA